MKRKITIFCLFVFISAGLYSQTYPVPDILYYKFNSGSKSTPNYANPGQGTNPAVYMGALSNGPMGQFDSALVGVNGSSTTTYVNTGWNMNFGMSSWTISMWINNISTSATNYIFGNDITTSFRCFTNGAAGTGNITLRGVSTATFPNVDVTGVLPGPSVVHFVYDSVTTRIKTYVNGVFQTTVIMPSLNLNASVVFKVGGYGTAAGIGTGWLVDEFRVYKRALDSGEVAATWNHTLPYTVTGVSHENNIVPSAYKLDQNYPNPFNPSTTINYSIPVGGNVDMKVYDMLGREIMSVVNRYQPAGNYKVVFDASNIPSGVYTYRIIAGNYTASKKMTLVK